MLSYLLLLSAIWGISLLLYRLGLRSLYAPGYQRIFLLFSLLWGLVFPLLPAASWSWATALERNVGVLPPITVSIDQVIGGAAGLVSAPAIGWLQLIFLVGSMLALFRLLRQAWRLRCLYRGGERCHYYSPTLVYHPAVRLPFSTFGCLFLPAGFSFGEPEGASILRHEQAHYRRGHHWDMLLLELLGVVFWWHPLWYGYRAYLREAHEVEADRAALTALDRRSYGKLLLRQVLGAPRPGITHYFNSSPIKYRIRMLRKMNDPQNQMSALRLLLPCLVVAFSLLGSAFSTPLAAQADSAPVQSVDRLPIFGDCQDGTAEAQQQCSRQAMSAFISANLQYPRVAKVQGRGGMVIIRLQIDADGQLTGVEHLKTKARTDADTAPEALSPADQELASQGPAVADAALVAEVIRVAKSMRSWRPAEKAGKPVAAQIVLPVKFALN